MGRMSRNKGKVGERELAAKLTDILGIQFHRGRQFNGVEGRDVKPLQAGTCDGVHWECKRVERLDLWKAVEQAAADAGEEVPVVCHRPSRREWLAIVPLDRLPELVERLAAAMGEGQDNG